MKARRPSRLKLAGDISILATGLAALAIWSAAGLGIIEKPFDPEAIAIGLLQAVLFIAVGWSGLRKYRAACRRRAEVG
jgi:predicted membrane channel-forming protein YqfA (hemolysin III family)